MRRKLGIPEGNTVLASIGRLAKEKNSTELLDGLTAFRGKPVTMLFVGDGPYRAEVQDHAASLGMTEQVIFTGMVPPEDVWKYYRLGDLFLYGGVGLRSAGAVPEGCLRGRCGGR